MNSFVLLVNRVLLFKFQELQRFVFVDSVIYVTFSDLNSLEKYANNGS